MTAAAGGVGLAAVDLAKNVIGAKVCSLTRWGGAIIIIIIIKHL